MTPSEQRLQVLEHLLNSSRRIRRQGASGHGLTVHVAYKNSYRYESANGELTRNEAVAFLEGGAQ